MGSKGIKIIKTIIHNRQFHGIRFLWCYFKSQLRCFEGVNYWNNEIEKRKKNNKRSNRCTI